MNKKLKNIAIIFAGGVGSRMKNTDKPKQFLVLDKKPIIIHTIEKFEKCNMIDAIAIACKEEFIEYLEELIKKFDIKKVRWIVPGGETGQLSIFNALNATFNNKSVDENAVVLIHDGVRPIIDDQLILENIVTARTHGNAITVISASETVLVSQNYQTIEDLLQREHIFNAKAPQTFYLKEIYELHLKEMKSSNYTNIDSCSIFFKHKNKLNFVHGKSSNIKITTFEDYYIFKALYELEQKRKKEEMLT